MNRKILALAIPSIIANITTPMLALADTAIVGHMGSAVFIAAIAVGGVMFNMLYWLFGFLRGGTSGLAAQAYGAADTRQTTLVLYRSLAVATLVGAAMIALQRPVAAALTAFLAPDPATAPLARQYFDILIWGAPAMLGTYALSGWFLGMQNSRMIMWTSLTVNVVNIAASLTLVYALKMQIAGLATGTLTAQWCGLGAGLLFLRGYRLERVTWRDVIRPGELRRFMSVNIYVMLRTACMIAVTLWFTRTGARQGAVILAVNTLLMQLFLLFSYMMDGFAFAGEALVGRYVGARQPAQVSRCIRLLFGWGCLLATVFTMAYLIGGEWFLQLLSSDRAVIAASGQYWWWALAIPFAGMAGFVWDGVYIGATLTRQLMVSMVMAMTVFFAIVLALFGHMGNHALWLAFISYLATRGIGQWLLWRHTGSHAGQSRHCRQHRRQNHNPD